MTPLNHYRIVFKAYGYWMDERWAYFIEREWIGKRGRIKWEEVKMESYYGNIEGDPVSFDKYKKAETWVEYQLAQEKKHEEYRTIKPKVIKYFGEGLKGG